MPASELSAKFTVILALGNVDISICTTSKVMQADNSMPRTYMSATYVLGVTHMHTQAVVWMHWHPHI